MLRQSSILASTVTALLLGACTKDAPKPVPNPSSERSTGPIPASVPARTSSLKRFLAPVLVPVPGKDLDIRWGFIDEDGNDVIPATFANAEPFSEGLAAVVINNKWGFIDTTGKVVIPATFLAVKSFSEGRAAVCTKAGGIFFGKDDWGFIDTTGKMVIPSKYAGVHSFTEGLAGVGESGNTYSQTAVYVDRDGKTATASGFMNFHPFNSGRAVVRDHGGSKPRVIDRTGKVVFTAEQIGFSVLGKNLVYREGLLSACDSQGKWGFLDITGKTSIPAIYDDAEDFSEGLAAVKKGERWGFIDATGKAVLPFIYRDPKMEKIQAEIDAMDKETEEQRKLRQKIRSELSFVELMLWYFQTTNGHDGPPRFSEGHAFAVTDDWAGYIDRKGDRIITAQPKHIYGPFESGRATVYAARPVDGKLQLFFQYINPAGKVIFERRISP